MKEINKSELGKLTIAEFIKNVKTAARELAVAGSKSQNAETLSAAATLSRVGNVVVRNVDYTSKERYDATKNNVAYYEIEQDDMIEAGQALTVLLRNQSPAMLSAGCDLVNALIRGVIEIDYAMSEGGTSND